MIFQIDATEFDVNRISAAELSGLLLFFRNVVREGTHLILISSDIGARIRGCGIDDKDAALIKYLEKKYTFTRSLIDRVKVFSKIVTNQPSLSKRNTPIGQQIVLIPVSLISCNVLVFSNKTKLLVENQFSDAPFFLLVASMVGKKLIFGEIALDPDHAGGSSLAKKAQANSGRYELTVAVTDSDRHMPTANLGSTASSLMKVQKSLNPLIFIKILPVHEIENMIPFDAIKHLHPQFASTFFSIFGNGGFGLSSAPKCPSRFIDIKAGLNQNAVAPESEIQFINWVGSEHNIRINKHAMIPSAPNVLASFLSEPRLNRWLHFDVFNREISDDFLEVFALVASVGVCLPPNRAVT